MNLFRLFYRNKPGEHKIRYIVRGNARNYNVTYKCGPEFQVVQDPSIGKGWKHTFVGRDDDYYFIAVQSNQPNSSVSLMVYQDGKLVNQIDKTGDYPIVQFSGAV